MGRGCHPVQHSRLVIYQLGRHEASRTVLKDRRNGTYTAENLDNSRGEVLLSQLAELEIAIRGEWRRLDDDGVPGDDRGSDLAAGEMDGEIPRNNSNGHTEGGVSDNDLLVIILLNNLFLKLDVGQGT